MSEPTAGLLAVRPAEAADVAAIVEIERAAFTDPWSARSFEALLGRDELLFEVATQGGGAGGQVVGYYVVYLAFDVGELANLAVGAAVRGQGVGRGLLQHALLAARGRGVTELFLEVRESNSAARRLYESLGFIEIGRRARYYDRPVEDALVLRRMLG